MFEHLGRWVMAAGLCLVVLGAAIWLLGRVAPDAQTGTVSRLLPGDLVVRRPGLTIYLPLATSLLLSLVLTGVLWLIGYLRR